MEFSVKGFNELHLSLKALIIGLLFVMPAWFIDIFLFYKTFFYSTPLYIIIVLSYVISLGWFLAIALLINAMLRHSADVNTKKMSIEFTVFFSMCILYILSAIWYFLKLDFIKLMYFSFALTLGCAMLFKISPVTKPKNPPQ
ncbi:MAG: hypothetical protein JWO32_2555 [Bacteroidetes bacterium]|nr:hypothetical protein [Bacteroidota bacterium]